jgi:hypothetical protein
VESAVNKVNALVKLLLLFVTATLMSGCMHPGKIVEQLKNDPATVDIQVQTIYGSFMFHRHFPTNAIPPR